MIVSYGTLETEIYMLRLLIGRNFQQPKKNHSLHEIIMLMSNSNSFRRRFGCNFRLTFRCILTMIELILHILTINFLKDWYYYKPKMLSLLIHADYEGSVIAANAGYVYLLQFLYPEWIFMNAFYFFNKLDSVKATPYFCSKKV